ncbi:MAG: HAD family phosphatase [Planctomycetota bacterium]|jgi:HAD superfamily hydrolase (TIGR01509 family)|nr:HAD family phosphatase [Planctomycetota bacterium]
MRKIEGVLCDLDGTLVDSEKYHLEAWNILAARGGDRPDGEWNLDCVGLPDRHTCEKARRLFPGLRKIPDPIKAKGDIFRELVARSGTALAFPGVGERLERLAAAGFRLAVGTNSLRRNTLATLEAAGLRAFFPAVVTLDSVANGKPAPDIYAAAAAETGLPPARCAVLEDSPAGIVSGKSAGCLVLGILNTWSADRLPGADRFFADTAGALDWLLEGAAEREGEP